MKYKKVKKTILTLGVAVVFVAAPGCFTGVESTPRISIDKTEKEEGGSTAEDKFFSVIKKQAPGQWTAGKRFTVVDDRFKRLLSVNTPTADLQGQVITLISASPVPTVLGDSVIEVRFASTACDTPLVYRTTLSTKDWGTRTSFAIPFLVETDVIEQASKLLTNRRLWVRTRAGWTNGIRRRFIPVIIDSVSGGDETYPLIVRFHAEENPDNQGQLFLSDADVRPGDRHSFGTYFSLKDLRGEYHGISDASWQAIVDGKLIAGMTPNEVRLVLGAPKEVRNTNTSSILRQEWLYADGRLLVFENQVLASWN